MDASVRAKCTQPLSNGGDGCCPWLRHGHLWVLARRKDGPGSCWFSRGTNEPRSMYWWAQMVALILGSSVAPKIRKGVMGDSPCAVPSCIVPAICCRALASNAWRSVPWESSADVPGCVVGTGVTGDGPASGKCKMGIAVASPAGCSGDEAVAVGTDVDDWATGGRG